jgi:hypothetical protein
MEVEMTVQNATLAASSGEEIDPRTKRILRSIDTKIEKTATEIMLDEAQMMTFSIQEIVPGGKIFEQIKEAYLTEAANRQFDAAKYVNVDEEVAGVIDSVLSQSLRFAFDKSL